MLHAPWEAGQAIIIAAVFFLLISLTIMFGVISPILRHVESIAEAGQSRGGFFAGEALTEDIVYRLEEDMNVPAATTLTQNGATAAATVADVSDGKEVLVTGSQAGLVRKIKSHLLLGTGASFHYGVQSGEGGIILENTSSIIGNVQSNGSVQGQNSNIVKGDVISAGPTGLIDGVRATSSVWAHTITNATIDKDAYYVSISNSTVGGVLYPNSPDQATSTLPITDAQIDQWKSDAEAGGVINSPCPYEINAATTIGPKKINCDLHISGNNFTVTLAGALWVVGNITITNSPTVAVLSSLGAKSVPVIADNPLNRTTSSKIDLANSATFQGSGNSKSYVLLISQNASAEGGGVERAVEVQNSVSGKLLVYAGHGEVLISNSVSLKEVTAYRIRLKNTASVTYESGLANLLFTAGPGGGYVFDGWREVE